MFNTDLFYLFFITFALCAAYFPLYHFLPYFLKNTKPAEISSYTWVSVAIIAATSMVIYAISYAVPSTEVGNRIVHAFGGGFLGFMVCFLAAKDGHLVIDKMRFFVFSFMLVSTLGVANEIVEFFLQNYFQFFVAPTFNDTWLDLLSNTVGALIAGACFTPFITSKKAK